MFEPVTGIRIPDDSCTIRASGIVTFPHARRIVMMQQAYDNRASQESILRLCQSLVRDGGITLVAVEGAKGTLGIPSVAVGVAETLGRTLISPGVAAAHSQLRSTMHVEGVDEPDLVAPGHQAMRQLGELKDDTVRFFRKLGGIVGRCQGRWYTKELRTLQARIPLLFQEKEMDLMVRVAASLKALRAAGGSAEAYPNLAFLHRLTTLERSGKMKKAEDEKTAFFQRLSSKVIDVWERELHLNDPATIEAIEPALQYWASENSYSQTELNQRAAEDVSETFRECWRWYRREIYPPGLNNMKEQGRILERLLRMALSVGVPYFDLHAFRNYVCHLRDVGTIDLMQILNELWEIARTAATAGGGESSEVFALEDYFERAYLSMRLGLVPWSAIPEEMDIQRFEEALDRIVALSDSPFRLSQQEKTRLDFGLSAARGFYANAQERSGLMADRTFAAMRNFQHHSAVLVVGGFHSDIIQRRLEDEGDLSWSVLTPSVEFESGSRPLFMV